MKLKYKDKKYVINEYYSIHHNVVIFYETIMKKDLNYFENIYISYIIYNKKYEIERIGKSLILKIIKDEKYVINILIPYIKVVLITLFIISRIDIFLSTYFNIYNEAFEDYYIIILYISLITIIFLITFYSYKFMVYIVKYICKELDEDIYNMINNLYII